MKAAFATVSLLTATALAGPCPDPRDPGCCLQTVPKTRPDGTVQQVPMAFDPVSNTVSLCVCRTGWD